MQKAENRQLDGGVHVHQNKFYNQNIGRRTMDIGRYQNNNYVQGHAVGAIHVHELTGPSRDEQEAVTNKTNQRKDRSVAAQKDQNAFQ